MHIPTLFINDRMLSIVVNVLIIGTGLCAGLSSTLQKTSGLSGIDTSELIAWGVFSSFLIAAVIFVVVARDVRASGRPARFAWLLAGICLLIALDALPFSFWSAGTGIGSGFIGEPAAGGWFQNLLPSLMESVLLIGIVLLFGLILPLLSLARAAAHVMGRYALLAPPLSLAPAFVAAVAIYYWKPFPDATVWVGLMLGLALLFTAVHWVVVDRLEARLTR
jgi:hypothetical protein